MIKEDHVSFEIAKLLKEKGFNEICRAAYTGDGKFITNHNYYSQCEDECVAPTYQMAMKWLREKHSFFIVIDEHFYSKDLVAYISSGFTYSYEIKHINTIHTESGFETYEEAVEKALRYCLKNLI